MRSLVLRNCVAITGLVALCVWLTGCVTPQVVQTRTTTLQPDEEDNVGGTFMDSADIRTVATKMSAALLSTPQIAGQTEPVRIAIAPIRNSTRFLVDKDIFIKRLRIELSKFGAGRVVFYSQGVGQETRSQILQEQDQDRWGEIVTEVADHLLKSPALSGTVSVPTIAVVPIRNTNLAGINADAITSLIRAKIAEKANGKVVFLARERNGKVIEEILNEKDLRSLDLVKSRQLKELHGVDFFLGGEFVGESLTVAGPAGGKPNVAKYLNVMLIDAGTGAVPAEKMVRLEREMKSGLAKTSLLLTGELSALSKAASDGQRSDYLVLSFQLVNPQTNEVLWEDAFETKKKSSVGTVYR